MADNKIEIQLKGAIEDNEDIRLSDFIDQLNAIRETLTEIDKKVSRSHAPSIDYRVIDLSHSSPSRVVLEAVPAKRDENAQRAIDISPAIVGKFFTGLQQIRSGSAPEDFDSTLLEKFAKIGKGFRRNIREIVISHENSSVNIGKTFEAEITKIIGEDQLADGAVTGTLEAINFHMGKNQFVIWPVIGPEKVTCHFPNNLLEDAIKAVGHYINVSGKLKYKMRDKFPYGIHVSSIETYPEESQLPSIFDLRGIAPNATGNLKSEDFIRKLRDAEQ